MADDLKRGDQGTGKITARRSPEHWTSSATLSPLGDLLCGIQLFMIIFVHPLLLGNEKFAWHFYT